MTPFQSFFPYIIPNAQGASEPLVAQTLRDVAHDFCRRTNLIQDIATVNARVGSGEYDVSSPTQMQLANVLYVAYDNRPLRLVPAESVALPMALRGSVPSSTAHTGVPDSVYFKTPTGSTFWLYPLSDLDLSGAITVKASFAPSYRATALDDALFADWRTVLVAGTLATLMRMPAQPFSSPLASNFAAEYESGVYRAKREASVGRIKTSMAVKPRRFA